MTTTQAEDTKRFYVEARLGDIVLHCDWDSLEQIASVLEPHNWDQVGDRFRLALKQAHEQGRP